jgi:hypothetical protein
MNSAPHARTATVAREKPRAAWDAGAKAELAFDFSPPDPRGSDALTKDWGARERSSVKDAILRWLEEQL